MRAAVTDPNGGVVNVILVEDDTFDPGDGLTLTVLPEDSPVGPGWRLFGEGEWVAPPRRDLTGNGQTIPPDGTTAATVTYTDTHDNAPTEVVFTVNGVNETVPLTSGSASLEVVSSTPGDTIEVTVDALPGATVTIYVEEA